MSMYLPKRLELSLRLVLALPNASSTGLDCRSLSFTVSTCALWPVAAAMNCNTFFDASVFPEPDSPAQIYVNRHSEQQHIQLISPVFSYDGDGGDNYSNNYNDYNDHGNVAEIQS